MSGPALHHLIAEQLRARINNGTGLGPNADYATLQALLNDPKNQPYFHLGCQGPDFLFFNTADWPVPLLGDFLNVYHDVYDAIDDFKKTLLELVPDPVLAVIDAAGVLADDVIEDSVTLSEIKALLEDMQRAVDALGANLTEMLKRFVSDFALFEQLDHPIRDGSGAGDWWWFDALHYRKTNQYAAALLRNAPPDSPRFLYALGHLTHVTADTVGHPFVNINSGGPYRNHAQRHKTSENYHDVFHMRQFDGRDWNTSQLHARYNFNYEGIVSPQGEANEVPDPHTRLPDELAGLIADTINQVYNGSGERYGRTIGPDDVDSAYRLYYRWLRSATDTGTLPAPVPYSLSVELDEVWQKATDNLDAIGDMLQDAFNTDGSFSILDFFRMLAAAVAAAVLATAALIDAALGLLATLTVAGLRAVLCLIYEHLYNAFQNFRLGVSLNGLAYPMVEHLDEPRFRQFQNTGNADSTGRSAFALRGLMPAKAFNIAPGSFWDPLFSREKHLIYPEANPEVSPVREAPDDYFGQTPLHYAFGPIHLNREFITDLAKLGVPSGQPQHDDASMAVLTRRHTGDKTPATLGNALTLAEELFDRWTRNEGFPAFNLDADRGYAYPCWTQRHGNNPVPADRPDELQGGDAGPPPDPVDIAILPQH